MIPSILAALITPPLNDAYIAGQSGSPKNLESQTPVRMATADIRIQVPSGKVKVTYHFTNPGPKTTVTMAFPEEGYDAYLDDKTKTHFKYFRSWVDGKEVDTKSKRLEDAADMDDWGYKVWWLKEVDFNQGQTRTVVNEYQSPHGVSSLPFHFLPYIIETAKTWNGTVKSIRAEIDYSELPIATQFSVFPENARHKDNKALWYWENVKPSEANNLNIVWAPENTTFSNERWKEAFGVEPRVR